MKKKKTKTNTTNKIIFSALSLLIIIFLAYSFWIPSSQIFGKTIYKNSDDKVILTFDDGPGPDTKKILDVLNENNMTAVFFITCEHIDENEIKTIKRMSANGNVVALHGENHRIFQGYNKLNSCKHTLENITGQQVKYFRPPYGFKSPNTIIAAHKLNMTVMTWSVFPRDYSAKYSKQIINRVKKNLKSNSIICFHDGPSNRENTANALSEIIRIINEKEYKTENLETK